MIDLSKLQALIKEVNLSFSDFIKINSDNNGVHFHVTIPEGEDPEKISEVGRAISSQIEDDISFFGKSDQVDKSLKLIKSYHGSGEDSESKTFISNLPKKDQPIWYSALLIREQFRNENNEEVVRLKQELTQRFPDRGGNIANLCTAGYLETHIMPLYKQLIEVKDDEDTFFEIYETIVAEQPFAVFVSRDDNLEDIKEEIVEKIKLVQQYGWKKVSVHGIGPTNVKKIQKVALEIEEDGQLDISSIDIDSHESEGTIITLTFLLT